MDKIFSLLHNKNQNATFFCLGWVAKKFPHIIKKINSMGYEIGTHSNMHQLAYKQSKDEFATDLKKSIDLLENIIGKKIKIYRAPGFSIKKQNLWVFNELIKNGIEIDCSIFPAKRELMEVFQIMDMLSQVLLVLILEVSKSFLLIHSI